ncbi:g794 [Coccomyxa elongata]
MPGEENKYFASLQMKAISGATNDARVEVAKAKKRGDIGTATTDGEASAETTRINAANVRQQEIERSNNQLRLVKLECEQEQAVRQKEAQIAPMNCEAILQTELNKLDAMKQLEFLRSTQFAKTTVEAESLANVAEGRATATKLEADVDLYKAQKEALAILAKAQAQAEGFMDTAEPELVKFFLGLERNLFVDMAEKTAQAVQGLNPKINISSGESDAMSPLRNLLHQHPTHAGRGPDPDRCAHALLDAATSHGGLTSRHCPSEEKDNAVDVLYAALLDWISLKLAP